MALLTFPLSLDEFFHLLPASVAKMSPGEALEVAETGGGEILTADIGTALWAGQLDMGPMTHAEAASVAPLLNVLRRAGSSFLVSDPTRPWPRLDPNAAFLGSSTPKIRAVGPSMRELSVEGLPAGYPLSRGDLLSFQYGTAPVRHALHELVGSAIADSAGQTGLIEVNPPLRPGAVAGMALQFLWPRCKARLVPGSAETGTSRHVITSEMSLRWTQTLR